MDNIDIHGIGVFGPGGGRSEGLVRMLSGSLVSSADFFCSLPLSLEMNGFGIPFLNGGWHGVHRHDSSHDRGRYSHGEISNKDIWIFDIGSGDVILELRDVLVQGGRVGLVLFEDHSFGCEPGDSGSSDIPLFKVLIEFGNEVHIGP